MAGLICWVIPPEKGGIMKCICQSERIQSVSARKNVQFGYAIPPPIVGEVGVSKVHVQHCFWFQAEVQQVCQKEKEQHS